MKLCESGKCTQVRHREATRLPRAHSKQVAGRTGALCTLPVGQGRPDLGLDIILITPAALAPCALLCRLPRMDSPGWGVGQETRVLVLTLTYCMALKMGITS